MAIGAADAHPPNPSAPAMTHPPNTGATARAAERPLRVLTPVLLFDVPRAENRQKEMPSDRTGQRRAGKTCNRITLIHPTV
jgi:hypothetical protein